MIRDFYKLLKDSYNDSLEFPLDEHFQRYFRGYRGSRPGSSAEDRLGADFVVETVYGTHAIDVKLRSEDPLTWGEDDLAVELLSVMEKGIRGYGNHPTHLMWAFVSTGRSVLIPFDVFKRVYDASWEYWDFWLREKPQWTCQNGTRYRSTHCYVPVSAFGPWALRHCTPKAGGRLREAA